MQSDLEPKALYNFLRMSWEEDPKKVQAQPWQIEDYRLWQEKDLFEGLQDLGIKIDEEVFVYQAQQCETPEELAALFLDQTPSGKEDNAYLLIFELWRKFFPERQSLSLFCDELDHRIQAYHRNPVDYSEAMQDALANLQEILEANSDEEEDTHQIFELLCRHCANDIECFLYDFIADEISSGDDSYAQELIDGFYPYVFDSRWFDFLNIRLWLHQEPTQACLALEKLLEDLKKDPDLDLYLEVLENLAESGWQDKFLFVAKEAISLLETQEDLKDLLDSFQQYCRLMKFHEASAALERLQNSQKNKEPTALVSCDQTRQTLQEIFVFFKS